MTHVVKRTAKQRKTIQRLVIFLVALACFVPFLSSALSPATAASDVATPTTADTPAGTESTTTPGLYLGKSATATSDGRGAEVTLSQYVTGGKRMVTESPKGADVVLLLDVSGSMGTSGIKALRSAVNAYVTGLAGTDTDLSIILFGGRESSATSDTAAYELLSFANGNMEETAGVTAATTAAAAINMAGNGSIPVTIGSGTYTGLGMEKAYNTLNALKDDGRNKSLVLFTDGIPSTAGTVDDWYMLGNCAYGQSYDNSRTCTAKQYQDPVWQANLAIKNAQLIKDMGGSVFTVGLFTGASANIPSASAITGATGWDTKEWKGTSGGGATATRRFLEAVSSDGDFAKATSYDRLMTNGSETTDTTDGVDNWVNENASGFMQVTADPSKLTELLTAAIKVPSYQTDVSAATTKSVAADFASEYFDVPTDASQIKVYEQAADVANDDGVVWNSTVTDISDQVTITPTTVNGNTGVSIRGWDYAGNYVGLHEDGTYGKRLIVRFVETAKSGMSGSLATNDTANSVFTGDDGTTLGSYPVPDPVDIVPDYDDSWIPDCDTSKNLKNGICLGKNAKATTDADGAQRSADIAMSAYSTGTTKSDGTETETKPVDIYYVLDYSNIPDQLNTNADDGTAYGAQWKDESTAIQKVLSNAISNVQAGTVSSRVDITTYAGSTKGNSTGAVNNVLSINNSTSEAALTTAKTAFAGTTCTTSGCTGDAAPTGTSAQLGSAMDAVWTRMQTSTSTNPKLVVVMSPPTGLGNYSWASGHAGCSTGVQASGTACSATSDPLAQADQAIAAAQKMKAAGATILSYSGIEDSGAEGSEWTNLTRSQISGLTGNNTAAGTLQGRQMQELVSSNSWGVTQMGISSDITVSNDLADVPTSETGGSSKVVFQSTSESSEPGTYDQKMDLQGQGYFYASVLSDPDAMDYFEQSVSELVQVVEVPKKTDTPDVTDGVTIADYASAYFETTAKAADVKVYEQSAASLDADGNPVFSGIPTQIAGDDDGDDTTPLQVDSAVKVTAVTDSKTGTMGYTVSGWDFTANYVGEHTDAKFFGKRLIVAFSESATEQFLGGANVPTNESGSKHDISGAYATDGFDGGAASGASTINTFPETKVNVDLLEVKAVAKNGKGYYGGALNLEKALSITDTDGNALDLAPLKDGSRNNDFVQVELSFDSGDKATSAGMIYSSGASSAAADYVASETPMWMSGSKLTSSSPIFMGSKDLSFSVIPYLEPVTPYALESSATPMSKDAVENGQLTGAMMDTATLKVYSLLPWIQWNDTQLELGDTNDFTGNLSLNKASAWRWTGGYSNTSKNADKIPDTDADGEANVLSEGVTAVPQFNFVTDRGDEPSKNPGDNDTNKVTDFTPTKNSDFTVTVILTGVDSKNKVTAYTANSAPSGSATTVAQSPSNKALNVSDSIENGYAAKTGYDFRVWVVDNYVDPGFPTTCVTSGDMCLGKEVSDVTTDSDGKRAATVTLTAYLTGSTSGAADSSANAYTKLADFASAYFGTDEDSTKVKVWEQSASKLGDTVEFHRNPVLLSESSRANISTPAMTVYIGDGDVPGIQVQSSQSAGSNNPGFNVQGFDYATNYVGERSGSSDLGKRIVMQFTETVDDCFIGGNDVPSNEESTPGIYTQPTASGVFPGSAFTQIAQFDNPVVDVPASAACATFADGKAYDLGSLDNGSNGLQSLIRSSDGTAAFSFGKIGSTDLQYNQFATTKFTFTNKATGEEVATYTIPSAQIGGDPVFKWTDDSAKTQGTQDITYTIKESVTLGADGPVDVTPASGNDVTVYALVPAIDAKDSLTPMGQSISMSENISLFSWQWIDATQAGDQKSDVSLVVSEKPAVQKLVYKLVRGTTPSGGEEGGTVSSTISPEENSDFKAGVILTTAAVPNGTTVYPSDINRTLVSRSNGDVVDGDKVASFSNGHDTEFDDYDFRVWVTGEKVSSLPLTGGEGTGRWLVTLGLILVLVSAGTIGMRRFLFPRE